MSRTIRFVRPQVVRLPLSGEDWVEVKRELTVGEQRKAMAKTVSSMRADGRIEPNLEQIGRAEIAAYLVDWSFVDEADKRVRYSDAALDNLTTDAYAEVEAAVRAHIAAVEDERKNGPTGSSSSSASPSAA